MNAVILGNGGSGKAAAELLRREGWRVTVLDGTDAWPEGAWDLCVTSPGVPMDHPWQNAARSHGVRIMSELQLGAERYRALGGRMLAVTGSKGKSSVVKLVADALGGIPCGNYGKPLCEVVLDFVDFMGTDPEKTKGQTIGNEGTDPRAVVYGSKLPIAIVEISSFQLETTELPPDTFEAAAILNLQEDHLDRHGTVAKYHALKRKLLDFASVKIVGTDPENDGYGMVSGVSKREKTDKNCDLFADCYFDNPILRDNGLSAVALMKAVGLADDAIRAAFMRFEALPHRMQTVGVHDGVAWVDDSKATSISALIAGVTMAYSRLGSVPRVRLIAGGLAKGDDPAMARECLAKGVAKVYLIGQCATAFAEAWKDIVLCEVCGTMDVAVAEAKNDSREGDCVLLSPGAASFDQFKSYGERGDRFAYLSAHCRCDVNHTVSVDSHQGHRLT
ncbi:MAG: hypothetical protein E7046_01790 [Lentisphaerae bacterium]|nr:hypothetical protein [Lentisphaerota bacterium]